MVAPTYQFRLATLADLPMLRAWVATPAVAEWWGKEDPFDSSDLDDPRFRPCIVCLEGQAFAYMQDYDVHGWPGHHFGYLPPGSRGIDQFIGVPGMLGLGHGTAFVRQHVAALFASGAPAVGTDPHPKNARAIAAYRKAEFRIVGAEEETEWGQVIRMEAWRETVEGRFA
jgi:aminoglycoside 6'-N-acetyltransferase